MVVHWLWNNFTGQFQFVLGSKLGMANEIIQIYLWTGCFYYFLNLRAISLILQFEILGKLVPLICQICLNSFFWKMLNLIILPTSNIHIKGLKFYYFLHKKLFLLKNYLYFTLLVRLYHLLR